MKSILVVDDSKDDLELIRLAFARIKAPFVLETAHGGKAAISRLLTGRAPLPDLVLLDLKMSEMDGFEVLRQIRADSRLAGVLIAIFSSSDMARDIEMTHGMGADAYISKPFALNDFARVVDGLSDVFSAVSKKGRR